MKTQIWWTSPYGNDIENVSVAFFIDFEYTLILYLANSIGLAHVYGIGYSSVIID